MTKTIQYTVALLLAVALFAFAYFSLQSPQFTVASVIQGNEYVATSTAPNNVFGAQTAQTMILKTGPGSLAQVVVSGANTGILNFYNATTSNINLRTGNTPTSTILLFSMPASLAAGTYTIDAAFSTGLVYDLYGGIMPTTTISYR